MDTASSPPGTVIPASEIPGPRTPMAHQGYKIFRDPAAYMLKCRERYGSRFKLRIMYGAPTYVLSDPDDVKAMFLAPADVVNTGGGNGALEKFIGESGLSMMDGKEHLERRKQILPTVRGGALKRIEASVAEMAAQAVASWPRGEVISLYPHIHRFTIQVIREVVYGKVVPSRWDEMHELVWEMLQINGKVASMIEPHRLSPASVWMLKAIRPLGLNRFYKQRERAYALVAQATAERLDSGDFGDDMLSALLGATREDGSRMSEAEIRDEIMTMFLAGTETTSAGICWALEYLSREPEILERLTAEIDEGGDDAFLTAVIHEVLRVRGPTPLIVPREVMKPIEIGGVRYAPGDWLWACGFLVHHDPAIYTDPFVFRPERFLGVKPVSHKWIPFGGGHARCLGDKVAILEMKAVLREVLTTCEMHRADPTPEGIRSRLVTITTKHGTRLELRPRASRTVSNSKSGYPEEARTGRPAHGASGPGRRPTSE